MNPISSVTETFTVKKDINVLTMRLRRSRKGILINLKADKVLEDLFRDWGGDSKPVLPNLHGRAWDAVSGPLPNCYALQVIPDAKLRTGSGKLYDIARIGCPLVSDEGQINLGFLRLIGISEADGVSFAIKGVWSTDEIKKVSTDLQEVIKHFYINYIKPVDVVIQMHTQEI
jgi:hypothetical protein